MRKDISGFCALVWHLENPSSNPYPATVFLCSLGQIAKGQVQIVLVGIST